MNLNEKIQKERERVAVDVEELKNQNNIDMEVLATLKEEYNRVLFSSNTNDIDFVNSQIKEVSARIGRRKEKIEIMQDENNPIIQDMITEELQRVLRLIDDQESQAKKKLEKLLPKHKELMSGISEVSDLYRKVVNARSYINFYARYLSDESSKNLNLHRSGIDVVGKLPHQMRKLLIQEKDLFK